MSNTTPLHSVGSWRIGAGVSYELHHILVSGPQSSVERTAVVLHGILGSGKNWRGFTRRLLTECPGWQFVLPDLRKHGASLEAPGANTVQACVEDIVTLCDAHGWRPACVIGHSFGGKVALSMAAQSGRALQSVWALDSPPSRRGPGARGPGSEVGLMLQVLRSVPMPAASRDDVLGALADAGLSQAMCAWMSTNLRSVAGGVDWRLDLGGVEALIDDYFDLDLWLPLRTWSAHARVNLLSAGHGGRWSALDRVQVRAAADGGLLRYHTLPASGHWVHVDDPDGLAALLVADLSEIDSKMARSEGPE